MEIDAIDAQLITETLRAWRRAEDAPPGLLDLDILQSAGPAGHIEQRLRLQRLVHDLVTAELDALRQAHHLPAGHDAADRAALLATIRRDFSVGNSDLEAWSALYFRFLAPLNVMVEELAGAIPVDARHFRRRVNAGIAALVDLLRRLEHEEHTQHHRARLQRHLPPADYARLFGIEPQRDAIAAQLRRMSGPDFISIEGIGGVGKTALARAVALDLSEDSPFEGILWVSARQSWLSESGAIQSLPGATTTLADIAGRLATQLGLVELAALSLPDKLAELSAFLRRTTQLIVIDNLESVSDVDALLPALAPMAGPSRFLLTSRQSMSHYPTVTRVAVPPLSLEDSRRLVESELRRGNRQATLPAADMADLHATVGGMPLALKLVAAQMSRWPLAVLLDNLRAATLRAPENLYTYIYRHTWLALNNSARQLLLSTMTVAPQGEDIDWLRLISVLNPEAFDDAMDQLLAYSLLEVAGPPQSPRYGLHRLTVTFLQTEVLGEWMNEPGPDTL